MKKNSTLLSWAIVLIIIISSSSFMLRNYEKTELISYTEFENKWIGNEIKEVEVNPLRMEVTGISADDTKFKLYVTDEVFNGLIHDDPREDIKISYLPVPYNNIWSTIIPIGCFVVVIGYLFFLYRTQQGVDNSNSKSGILGFGKSNARIDDEKAKKVTFADVAGADEEKAELEEIVDFLKKPGKYTELGARIPKGVLLVGPPGTGKTLLAKAIAGEANVPFYSISGSNFVEMFVGVGASRVRDLFEQAKRSAPALIFIDEIDAVGRQRGAGLGGGHDEREQTLNQLLVEMDGFSDNEGIIMIAATNRPDILDKALLRPGRFDRQIVVGSPDKSGRIEILKIHTANKPLDNDVELDILAKRTPGFSGADLQNLANEAALLAVRNNKKKISMEEFEEAITRVIAGPEKRSKTISDTDRKLTAYHEAGHAVVMKLLKHSDPVHKISIIPRGMAGGFTMHLPNEDRAYTSKEKLKDEMVALLGGRVAEKLILGDISTGAKNDIDRATAIARAMVMDYGMSDKIGTISYGDDQGETFIGRDFRRGRVFSEKISSEIDIEVKSFISEAYYRAETIIKENINKVHSVANELLEKETLDKDEFENIFNIS